VILKKSEESPEEVRLKTDHNKEKTQSTETDPMGAVIGIQMRTLE
jgi:hypothetical protein